MCNPRRKKDSVTRELRRYNGRFTSIAEVKVRIVEEFEDFVPQTRRFSVGILVMLLQNIGYAVRMILQHFILHMRHIQANKYSCGVKVVHQKKV